MKFSDYVNESRRGGEFGGMKGMSGIFRDLTKNREQRQLDKAKGEGLFVIYKLKKDGTKQSKPFSERFGSYQKTMEAAEKQVKEWERLNPGAKFVIEEQ